MQDCSQFFKERFGDYFYECCAAFHDLSSTRSTADILP
jgi:hypothetical protein